MNKKTAFTCLLLLCVVGGCNQSSEDIPSQTHAEPIKRLHNESFFLLQPPEKIAYPRYPWEEEKTSLHPKITKEFFRCKGSSTNNSRSIQEGAETKLLFDCEGAESHSLPLQEGKEFIFPILLDLLNYVQNQTGKRVFITSGHRCPTHNTYIDESKSNRFSKHQLGAEVSFYVQSLEQRPEEVIVQLQRYYQETPKYEHLEEYQKFQRWDKPTDVSTPPWYNKEIFLKLYQKNEGRNGDNKHPFPYISIQVRYNPETKERVFYSWDAAFRNFLRF